MNKSSKLTMEKTFSTLLNKWITCLATDTCLTADLRVVS